MASILVIEDDPELLGVITSLLSSESHDVTGAKSGEEALQVAKSSSFDLVVADVRMEGMSGLDAIERVKKDDSEVKSLVITGYASEEDSIRAISLGVEAYLKKPFSLDDFLDAVNRALHDLDNERAAQQQRLELTASFQWALTALSRMVEQSPEAPPLSKLEPTVDNLCHQLGVVEAVRSAAVVTSLYLGVRGPLEALVLEDTPRFPRAIERALESLDEWFDGSGQPQGLEGEDIPLETRIAQVAYAAVCETPQGEEPSAWLSEHHEGRYDPSLLSLLTAPEKKSQTDMRASLHAQRSLLSLGKAFEEAGNRASARQAFRQVLEHPTNRFAMEASLSLARLAAQEGKEPPRKVQEQAERTLRLAEYVGAAPFGWCGLELGLLLHDVGLPEVAEGMLDRAEQAFHSLKLKVGTAALSLARYCHGRECSTDELVANCEVVFRSNFSDRTGPLIVKLLPRLLSNADDERLGQAADKLVRDYPHLVLECLYNKVFDTKARLRVAEVNGRFLLPHRDSILERLANDDSGEVRNAVDAIKASEAGTVAVPPLRIFSLGPMSAYRGDVRVQETQWRSQKAKYLLAMLAAAGERPVSEDKILDCFWPDSAKKGRNCLYWSTSTLRQALKVEGFEMDVIIRTGSGLQLNPELPQWHDLALFQELADSVRKGATTAYNIEDYLHVLDLYRGPYLEGCYYDWVVAERHRLEVLASELLNRFIDWTLQKQRYGNTLDYALRLLDIDPSLDGAHLSVMKAWLGLGKPQEAIDHFSSAEKLLRLEYDAEPSIEMMEYRQRALMSLDDLSQPNFG